MLESQLSHAKGFWAIEKSDRPAFVYRDGTFVSYGQLAEDIAAFSRRIGQRRGPIGILCDGDYRQYVACLAALNAGCPVLLMGEGQTAEGTGLSLAYLYAAATDTLTRFDAAVESWHPDLAVLLSTSGSTGSAKWVRLSFRNIAANAASIAAYLSLGPHDRAPMALPFQYSYGMSIVNSHLAVGAAVVLIEGSVIDARFWEVFEHCGCTSLAGVPHSFELMEQARIRTDHLVRLRYMTQAGGRLDPARVRHWVERGRAEGWEFFVMYGQTEAAPRIAYLPPAMALETPSAIGIPVPGGEIWIADEEGRPVPDGAQGELVYRGANTMMGYAQSDADLTKGQGSDILKTGDIARRLPNGAFEIVGRKNRFVKLFGLRIGLDEVEKHLQAMGVEAACVARDDLMYVLVADRSGASVKDLGQHLAAWLGVPAGNFRLVAVDALPRQASGKVDLQAIGRLLEGLPADPAAKSHTSPARKGLKGLADRLLLRRRNSVAEVFRIHFPQAAISSGTSFTDLGGDSLSYVAVSLEIESVLGHLPGNWPGMSVAELDAQARERRWAVPVDTPTLVRALAIMLVVAGHVGLVNYGGGGAFTLFVVAGMFFDTFTLPQVLELENVVPIAVLAIRIALPTLANELLYFAVSGYGQWPAFLFIGNWISPRVQGASWFVEVYLQLLVALMVVLSFAKVRRMIRRNTFRVIIMAAAALVGVAALSDALVDTNDLYRRLPHLCAWFLMVGVAAGSARTKGQKALVTAILLLGIWQFDDYRAIGPVFFLLASLALIWLPSVSLPKVLTSGARMIAGASLIIYITHQEFSGVVEMLLGAYPVLSWALALVGGVVLWRIYDPVDAWLGRRIRALLLRSKGRRPGAA